MGKNNDLNKSLFAMLFVCFYLKIESILSGIFLQLYFESSRSTLIHLSDQDFPLINFCK